MSLSFSTKATTWFPVEKTCPVCKHKNKFKEVGSYGSYLFQWPSKHQYVYWPLTDSQSVYSCSNCHFSTYMWDFDSIPLNKIDAIKSFLKTVNLNTEYKRYTDTPITIRLEIAEETYKILGRDNEFWCHFHRLLGFHYDKSTNSKKSKRISLKSIECSTNNAE